MIRRRVGVRWPVPQSREKVGLWVIGATGGVGSTVALGLSALAQGGTDRSGLVTALPEFDGLNLVPLTHIVFGGHEIREESLRTAAGALGAQGGLFDDKLLARCTPALRRMQRNVRPGTLIAAGASLREMCDRTDVPRDRTPAAAVERLAADINAFRVRHKLARVVVVHAASCEPRPAKNIQRVSDYAALALSLRQRTGCPLPTSSLYALAALEAGCAYVNFTPSLGIDIPALKQRARSKNLPFMGNDGKTGETLVKSVLAPMFAMRHLPVLSWFGQNILGNRDGAVLNDPAARSAKVCSKNKTIRGLMGRETETKVSIDYVPSLGDWKIAWDFVHFRGFLGTKMSLQFTWQGADSVLAAPLIIDLARLMALEHRRGHAGAMKHLAFFFKDPMETTEFNLFGQWHELLAHVRS